MYSYSVELFSDLHKDVNGFRPRGHQFYEVSDPDHPSYNQDEAQKIWNYYTEQWERNLEWEKKQRILAEEEFEQWVSDMIDMGAGDRNTAIRWAIDTYSPDDDIDYIVWDLNLPHKYYVEFMGTVYKEYEEYA
jgi:hypothetical protein